MALLVCVPETTATGAASGVSQTPFLGSVRPSSLKMSCLHAISTSSTHVYELPLQPRCRCLFDCAAFSVVSGTHRQALDR